MFQRLSECEQQRLDNLRVIKVMACLYFPSVPATWIKTKEFVGMTSTEWKDKSADWLIVPLTSYYEN